MTKLNKRQISKAQTKDKALSAARTLWRSPGSYQEHGMREIAQFMGMSTGAVFANFKSKDELWKAAFDCAPPTDNVLTRAAPAMFRSLQRLIDVRPELVDRNHTEILSAWREAEAIVERIKEVQLQEEARLGGDDEVSPMELAA